MSPAWWNRPAVRRRGCSVVVCGAAVYAAALPAVRAETPARDAVAQANFRIDHFECYRLRTAPVTRRTVKLRDQFGSRVARVLTRPRLCNPVSKNGGQVRDRRAHLVCYGIRSTTRFTRRHVSVENQFTPGDVLDVLGVDSLCLPSGKSTSGLRTPIPTTLDHYECYRVRPVATPEPRTVT